MLAPAPPLSRASLASAAAYASAVACLLLTLLPGCASIPAGRAAVDAVHIEGNHALDTGDIEDKLATAPSPKFLALWSGVIFDYEIFDRFVLQRDLARVERFYRARGYYEAHARAGRVEYANASRTDHVKITIEVEEGPPVNIKVVHLEGAETAPPDVQKALIAAAGVDVVAGKPFDEEKFETAEHDIKRALTDHGYAYAQVKRSAYVDLPHHTAELSFGIVTDSPATYGPIKFVGLGDLPEDVVERTFNVHEGEAYSTKKLDDAQQALLDLGVFSSVDIVNDLPDPPPADHRVGLTVKLERSKLHALKLGGGVELDVLKTDLHLFGEWENRNFFGGLRRFNVRFTPGVVLYPMRIPDFHPPTSPLPEEKFRVELQQPAFLEARTHALVRAEANVFPALFVTDTKPDDPVLGYGEAKFAAGVNRVLWKLFGQITYNAQYAVPFSYVGAIDPTLPAALISYVEILTQFDFRDDRVHPHSGLFLGNNLQVAGLGGDAQDIRVQPEARGYVPVTRKVTFALRASPGILFPFNYGSTLQTDTPGLGPPPGVDKAAWAKDVQLVYFRSFFSGGPSSNRGWPLRAIGPHGIAPFYNPGQAIRDIANKCAPNPDGSSPDPVRCASPLGGLTLWEAQAEVRFPIGGPVSGDTFCDGSDVAPKQAQFRFSARRLHLSCGVGLRYDTPVGPIRLDIAYRIPGVNPTLDDIAQGLDGNPGSIFGVPIAIAFGIGEAF